MCQTTPAPGGMPMAQLRCEQGAHYVPGDEFLEVRDGAGLIYRGCYAHLRAALVEGAVATPAATNDALQLARRVLTQPATHREVETAVTAIDGALRLAA